MAESGSWLREKRLAAGFATNDSLGRAIDAPMGVENSWERGDWKPSWRYIGPLAAALTVTPEDVIAALWGERVGDPCDCGCGGEKVLPLHLETSGQRLRLAQRLPVRQACKRCGELRIRVLGPKRHRPLCPSCSVTSPRVPRIRFTCVGYDDHGSTRFARSCPGTLEMTAADVRKRQRAQMRRRANGSTLTPEGPDSAQHDRSSFWNTTTGACRCGKCANAAFILAVLDRRLRRLTKERVRSGRQRRDILRDVIGDLNPNLVLEKGGGNPFRSGKKYDMADDHRMATVKGRLVQWWSRPVLPHICVSRCVSCGKLTFSHFERGTTGDWHRPCLNEWYRTPEGKRFLLRRLHREASGPIPLPPSSPGHPAKPESLRRHFAWAIQHYLGGQSYRQIAKSGQVTHQSVEEAVSRIVKLLPDSGLVPRKFQYHIKLLRDAALARVINLTPSS